MDKKTKRSMNNVCIKEMIDEAYFRIVYEYDFLHPLTLFFEHYSTEKKAKKKSYPSLNIIKGEIFFPELNNNESLEKELLEDFNSFLLEDEEDDVIGAY